MRFAGQRIETTAPGVDPRDYLTEPGLWASQLLPLGVSIDQAIQDGAMRRSGPRSFQELGQAELTAAGLTNTITLEEAVRARALGAEEALSSSLTPQEREILAGPATREKVELEAAIAGQLRRLELLSQVGG